MKKWYFQDATQHSKLSIASIFLNIHICTVHTMAVQIRLLYESIRRMHRHSCVSYSKVHNREITFHKLRNTNANPINGQSRNVFYHCTSALKLAFLYSLSNSNKCEQIKRGFMFTQISKIFLNLNTNNYQISLLFGKSQGFVDMKKWNSFYKL